MGDLWIILFWGVPIALFLISVVSLLNYVSIKREMKNNPEGVNIAELKKKKTWMLIFAIPAVVMLIIVFGFILLFFTSIAFM